MFSHDHPGNTGQEHEVTDGSACEEEQGDLYLRNVETLRTSMNRYTITVRCYIHALSGSSFFVQILLYTTSSSIFGSK